MEEEFPVRMAAAAIAALLALIVAIPLLYAPGTFSGLDGSPGRMDWTAPGGIDPVSAAVYALGDLLCHQMESRSPVINGSEAAFCARDLSVMAGALAALIPLGFKRLRGTAADPRAAACALALSSATFIEWAAEHALGAGALFPRAASGALTGVGLAVLLRAWAARLAAGGG
ncbi:MAG: DUF2085 domain-containing protein [Candidatus Methanoplasma sp.]|jgi:hypothetical protein|nr:DUF2085 domain-containing protein [Candidatus Methanoplasma sp.]